MIMIITYTTLGQSGCNIGASVFPLFTRQRKRIVGKDEIRFLVCHMGQFVVVEMLEVCDKDASCQLWIDYQQLGTT